MLYSPEAHEPLEGEWDERHARAAIKEIADDAIAAYSPDDLWPLHPRDADGPEFAWSLYLGGAGIAWALRELGADADLAGMAERCLAIYRERADEPVPSLWIGETGILLVLYRLTHEPALVDELEQLIRSNARNETNELMWGAPGTMLAGQALLEWTGEERFADAWQESADHLWAEWADDGLWTQHLYGSVRRFLGPAHGFAGNVLVLERGRALLDEERRQQLGGRAAATVERLAFREDGLANWGPLDEDLVPGDGIIRVQWCHGAPGIVCSLAGLADRELLEAAGELTWRAGPLRKGPNLCHGTAGNGYAFLKLHELTGDERWLERARAFAAHAILQVDRERAEHGRGRYSLWTGDLGAALYVRSCIDADPRVPTVDYW